MNGQKQNLLPAFPPTADEEWRLAVERELQGAPFEKRLCTRLLEGLTVQPLYTARMAAGEPDAAGYPGFPPFTRGTRFSGGWAICQEYSHPDLEVARAAVQADLRGGAGALWLIPDRAGRSGSDLTQDARGVGEGGLILSTAADFAGLLAEVDLARVPIVIEGGAAALPLAALFLAAARGRGIAWEHLSGCLGADPLGTLAREGRLPGSLDGAWEQAGHLARWTAAHAPRLRALLVSTIPYHDAGAHAVQELALAAAGGVLALRQMEKAGLSPERGALQIQFAMAVGRDLFVEIAKLRAARRLWARIVGASGGGEESRAMALHARGSWRDLAGCDPWVNLLRVTLQGFSAAAGGAASLCTPPFDEPLGLPSDFSRRLARNTQLLLDEEAHLGRVIDPAGGSWYVESLTSELASAAWEMFQHIERQGGLAAALQCGWVQEQIAAVAQARRKAVATRRDPLTGVSEFPLLAERPVPRPAFDADACRRAAFSRLQGAPTAFPGALPDPADPLPGLIAAAAAGAPLGLLARQSRGGPPAAVMPLQAERLAAPFEHLRAAARAHQERRGAPLRVFLANLGPVIQHKARASFTTHFFEAGGIEALGNTGFETAAAAAAAFQASGARLAAICSTDEVYAAMVPELAPLLKERGAAAVIVAGRPGEQEAVFRAAGVDTFIFMGADLPELLREMHRRLEVAP